MIVEIKRKFSCTYGILEVENTPGGADETLIRDDMESIQLAISVLELIERHHNCNYYITLEYEEMPA